MSAPGRCPVADGGVHQLVPREGPAGLPQQALQQAKLRRRQFQLAAVGVGAVAHAVDAHVEMFDEVERFTAGLEAALHGLDALQQHLDAERLGNIVVGPQRETDDLIGLLGLGAKDDNGDLARPFAGPQLAADLQAGQPGSIRSRITRSGSSVCALRSPSWPSWATMVS